MFKVDLLKDGSWYNRCTEKTHTYEDERFGGYTSHGYYIDITSWTGNISVDYPMPDDRDPPKDWGIPFTVSWENLRSKDAIPAHEEFNIRRRRSWYYGSDFGYRETHISDIPTDSANMNFAGRWEDSYEGSIFINMTMKCSYNLVRASGDNRLSGTLNARVILDHLINKDSEFDSSWNISDAEWTVTAQGLYTEII